MTHKTTGKFSQTHRQKNVENVKKCTKKKLKTFQKYRNGCCSMRKWNLSYRDITTKTVKICKKGEHCEYS